MTVKTIGLIGGMSWESTQVYYKRLNEQIRQRLGGLNSAECILHSVNFSYIEAMQRNGEWEEAGRYLAEIAKKLERSGAEGIVLCTNTMHRAAPSIESAVSVPFLHIGEAAAKTVRNNGHRNILLLGTKYTMEQSFLTDRLKKHGLKVTVPQKEDREEINRIIFEELCIGEVTHTAAERVKEIISRNEGEAVEAVILGCTELEQLFLNDKPPLMVYDTTAIHIEAAVDFMLED
jgi:aspartate racemase